MVASDGPASADEARGDLTEWTFPEGQLVRRLEGRPEALSPDWKFYASFEGVREAVSGRQVGAQRARHAFSADSRQVVELGGPRGAAIRIIELDSGTLERAFGTYAPQAAAFSPDGTRLAAGYWDEVLLWSTQSGRRQAGLRGFGRYVVGLAFSRDGQVLVAGTDAGGVQAWDVRHRMRLWSVSIIGGEVSIPAVSPDGGLVAVGVYGTGTVWLINVATGQVIDHRLVSGIGCGSVAFSPDGRFLITPSTGGLVRWPYDRGGTIRVFRVGVQRRP
jgi:WD40 repeat protein